MFEDDPDLAGTAWVVAIICIAILLVLIVTVQAILFEGA